MNKILILSVMLTCGLKHWAFGHQKIDAQNWRKIGKFDPTILSATLGNHAGKIIAVRFNFRGKDIHHIKSNWYEGSIWQPDEKARKGFSNIRVVFAKNDLLAFQSITTDSTSPKRLTVYGRVEYDADSSFPYLRLFGPKATIDSAGNATVRW
jgi:hypothetical protein